MALQVPELLHSDEGRIPQPEPGLRSPTQERRPPASERPRHGQHLFAGSFHVVGFAPVLLDQGNQLVLVTPSFEAAVTTNHELAFWLMLACRHGRLLIDERIRKSTLSRVFRVSCAKPARKRSEPA